MPGFVVLRHELPPSHTRTSHFDLMLQHDAVLLTWALDQWPIPEETIAAEQLPDHRLAYLEYEGPVSGDRGSVSRVDAGQFEIIEGSHAALTLRLNGQKLKGTLRLLRDDSDAQRWRVAFSPG